MVYFEPVQGFLNPRDHTEYTDIEARACIRAVAVKKFDDIEDLPSELYEDAFFEFAHYLQADPASDEPRFHNAWSWATPVELTEKDQKAKTVDGFLPTRDLTVEADKRYLAVEEVDADDLFPVCVKNPPAATVAPLLGVKDFDQDDYRYRLRSAPLLKGHGAILLAGSEELEQCNLVSPIWQGLLTSDHRSKDKHRFSTRIIDGNQNNEIDPKKTAGLDSVFKTHTSWDKNCTVALFMGKDPKRLDIAGGLFETFGLFNRGELGQLAYAGETRGGPLSSGFGQLDKHFIGFTDEGFPICQGHYNPFTPWAVNPEVCAPMEITTLRYIKAFENGAPHRVTCRYDPESRHVGMGRKAVETIHSGLLRWEVFVPIFIPDGVFPPEPEDYFPPSIPGSGIPEIEVTPFPDGTIIPTGGLPQTPVGETPRAFGVAFLEPEKPKRHHAAGLPVLPLEDIERRKNIVTRAHVYNELGSVSISFRGVLYGQENLDLRYTATPTREELTRAVVRGPEAARLETFTRQAGNHEAFVLANEPGSTRDGGGDIQGGVVFLNPQDSLDGVTNNATKTNPYFVFYEDCSILAFGTPDFPTGTVRDAYSIRLDKANGELDFRHHDSSAAIDTIPMTIESDCVDIGCLKIDGVEAYSVSLGVLTSNEVVADTTTNTKVFAPEIEGDTLEVGQVVKLTMDGTIRNETASTVTTVQIRAYFGGEVFFDSGSISLDPTSAAQFRIETGFTVRTIGATGTIRPHQGRYTIPDGTGGPTEGLTEDNDANHTVNTTSNQEVQVYVQFGDADSAIEAIAINAQCWSMR